MSKHTKGPWHLEIPSIAIVGGNTRSTILATIKNKEGEEVLVESYLTSADAHLIAAAPELLKIANSALTRAMLTASDNFIEQLLKVIAKAEGSEK